MVGEAPLVEAQVPVMRRGSIFPRSVVKRFSVMSSL